MPATPSSITENQRTRLPGCRRSRREALILERARGRRVLHVGACDSPYWKERIETGSFLHSRITEVAGECEGVDVDREAIEDLRAHHGVTNVHACEPGGIHRLGRGTFDVIVAADVIEHVSNPGAFLEDLAQVLAPGGELVLTTVNTYSPRRLLKIPLGTEVNHPDHVAYYSYLTLRQLLEREGFRIEEVHGYPCESPAPLKARVLDRLALRLSPYLGDGIAVVARRVGDAGRSSPQEGSSAENGTT